MANSANIFKEIKSLLNEYGLDTVDLSAMTTDGVSVMANVANLMQNEEHRKIPFHHQKCLAHALHLVVEDILKPKKKNEKKEKNQEQENNKNVLHVDSDDDYENDDNDGGGGGDDDGNEEVLVEAIELSIMIDGNVPLWEQHGGIALFQSKYGDVLNRVRSVVRVFASSAPNNDLLLERTKDLDCKLLLDVRTRWNSSYHMLERFLKLVNRIQSLYDDQVLGEKNKVFPLSNDQIELAKEMEVGLSVLNYATLLLSKRDATLSYAERIFTVSNNLSTKKKSNFCEVRFHHIIMKTFFFL